MKILKRESNQNFSRQKMQKENNPFSSGVFVFLSLPMTRRLCAADYSVAPMKHLCGCTVVWLTTSSPFECLYNLFCMHVQILMINLHSLQRKTTRFF